MSIFQNTVVAKHLKGQNSETVTAKWNTYKDHFLNPTIQENIRNSKEEQYQGGFIIDLFVNVLGYIKNPTPNFNITTEYKNVKDSKKADAAIIINDKVVAVVELKGTNTTDLAKVETQAFGYKNNQPECTYVITSNFEKLRFYIDNAIEHIEFNLFTLTEEEFKLLYLCLAYENIEKDIPKKIKEDSLSEEDAITKKLYKDYSLFRRELHQSLVELNPQYDALTLFKKTQKLLDRFLFLFFAEDRQLLPPNSVRLILEQWNKLKELDAYTPLFDRFKKYFGYLNTGFKGKQYDVYAYNGGLFKADEVLDTITIDDDLLYKHTLTLSEYDFNSEVDVNILGHIFENSLSELEEIQAKLEGQEIDKSKSKRKKDGVFYTPKFITKYIVENTVGKLCEEKKVDLKIKEEHYTIDKKRQKKTRKNLLDKLTEYREWLLHLTICDPACGSGAFLNQALDFLITEHRYIDELQAKLFGDAMVLSDVEKSILENNLFGVDINQESIEIAKLSLWLRTAQPNRKLNDLSNNIKCGNSLIDDPEVAGDKTFNWKQEFPQIFAKGGFDIVIGNPPYVDIKELDSEIVKYLFQTYKSANNRVNLYSSFIEKSLNLISNKGYFSFIIPSSLLTQSSYADLRCILLNQTTIKNIIRLPNESFGGSAGEVKVDTIILTFKSEVTNKAETEIIIYKGFDRISEISKYNSDINFIINPFDWKSDENFIFRINVDNTTTEIINKCQLNTKKLIDCADFCLGLTPYDKYKGHSQEQIKNRVFHLDYKKDDTYRMLLAGNDIKRYNVEWGGEEWISYGKWLGAPREKRFFVDKRILVKQIIDWSDKRIWSALTNEEFYNTQNAFNLIPKKEKFEAEYLIALLNSNLMSFYHKKHFLDEFKDRFQKILIKDAKEFPVKNILIEEQQIYIEKVQKIISQTVLMRKLIVKFISYFSGQFSLNKLSRKLQNWQELKFREFIIELNKANKKVGGEKLSKLDEMEWMDVFETKKDEVQDLEEAIVATDAEIDKMVYDLYGLTKEEIEIVENS